MITRLATESDIPRVIETRIAFANCISPVHNEKEYAQALDVFIREHFNDGSLMVMITEDDNVIVAMAMLCITVQMPRPSLFIRKEGLVVSMYTNPNYRRQGHASHLLQQLFVEAKKIGVNVINLSYTDMGYPLYVSLGFKKKDKEMCLEL